MPSVNSNASGDSYANSCSVSSDDTPSSRATEGSSDAEKEQLAAKESKTVFLLRVVVIIVLLLAAVAVSVVVYLITRNAEIDEYETQYKALADTVLRAFEDIVTQKMGAISSVGVAAIAHGVDHKREWPFLTLSSFQERSATARSLSGALFVSINPLVKETERTEWEKFVVEEAGWISAGYEYQEDLELDGFEKVQRALGEDGSLQPTPNRTDDTNWAEVTNRTGDTSWIDDTGEIDDRDEIFYFDEGETWIDPGPGPYLPGKFSFPSSQLSMSYRYLLPYNFCR
jgi:hypothetical protein